MNRKGLINTLTTVKISAMFSKEMGLKSLLKTTPAEFFVSNHTAKRTSEIILPCANPVSVSES